MCTRVYFNALLATVLLLPLVLLITPIDAQASEDGSFHSIARVVSASARTIKLDLLSREPSELGGRSYGKETTFQLNTGAVVKDTRGGTSLRAFKKNDLVVVTGRVMEKRTQEAYCVGKPLACAVREKVTYSFLLDVVAATSGRCASSRNISVPVPRGRDATTTLVFCHSSKEGGQGLVYLSRWDHLLSASVVFTVTGRGVDGQTISQRVDGSPQIGEPLQFAPTVPFTKGTVIAAVLRYDVGEDGRGPYERTLTIRV